MFNYEDFYKLYNCKSEAKYQEVKSQLNEMMREMVSTKERGFREKMFWYVKTQGEYLLMLTKMEEKWNAEYYQTASLLELKQDQDKLFSDLDVEQYDKSYANPAYMVSLFGKELGPVLATYAKLNKDAVEDAYCHRRFVLADLIEFYIEVQKKLLHGQVRAEGVAALLKQYVKGQLSAKTEIQFHKEFNVSNAGWTDLILNEDLLQPYYLYQFGLPVSEQEEQLQKFFAALPQNEIDRLAKTTADGFKKGFARDNKDIKKKNTAALYYPMGMERLVKQTMQLLRAELEVEPYVTNIRSAGINQQYLYDHRFDRALYLDEEYCAQYKAAVEKLVVDNETMLQGYGGPVVIESFGEIPFEPIIKVENLKMSPEQDEIWSEMLQFREQQLYQAGKLAESSYTMIALPVPAIGENFEKIFHEIVSVNCSEQEYLAKAQNSLISTLDRGIAVQVRGRGENETDLTVALQPIQNPKKQTNFFNCMADVNIPAGEVFTSPQLAGTTGLLHVEKAYLNGLCYENLKIRFEDGYVTEYGCDNYEDQEQGKQYIYENIMHPHKTLPMGEFAIGTNTQAYCVAKKYDIMNILPVLIIEKIGPHFAIGDTCYAYEEDRPVFNPMDHKEITAKDNERSILRKTEPEQAYLHKHIDITLPMDAIGRMSVVKSSGDEIDLIREGRFVLIGTDLLNAPIMAMEKELEGELYGADGI